MNCNYNLVQMMTERCMVTSREIGETSIQQRVSDRARLAKHPPLAIGRGLSQYTPSRLIRFRRYVLDPEASSDFRYAKAA